MRFDNKAMTQERTMKPIAGPDMKSPSLRKITSRRRQLLGLVGGLALAAAMPGPESRAASTDDLLYDWGAAPELVGLGPWFNSEPLTLAGLSGQVVLIDFWTHGCINCLRTLPHVNRWAARHREAGLVVIGVHSPEFAFERSPKRVETAIRRFGVRHPVALDNDHATWRAWANQYWPAHYLIDRAGQIRYRHFGEGDYDRTEAAILALLG